MASKATDVAGRPRRTGTSALRHAWLKIAGLVSALAVVTSLVGFAQQNFWLGLWGSPDDPDPTPTATATGSPRPTASTPPPSQPSKHRLSIAGQLVRFGAKNELSAADPGSVAALNAEDPGERSRSQSGRSGQWFSAPPHAMVCQCSGSRSGGVPLERHNRGSVY